MQYITRRQTTLITVEEVCKTPLSRYLVQPSEDHLHGSSTAEVQNLGTQGLTSVLILLYLTPSSHHHHQVRAAIGRWCPKPEAMQSARQNVQRPPLVQALVLQAPSKPSAASPSSPVFNWTTASAICACCSKPRKLSQGNTRFLKSHVGKATVERLSQQMNATLREFKSG